MRNRRKQNGLTLMETLVAVAIILTLIGILAASGKKIKQHSEIELTQSTLAVVDTALQVYYDEHQSFVPMASGLADFQTIIGGTVTFTSGTFPDTSLEEQRSWRNVVMYYFLQKEPKSRSVVNSLLGQMITNKDAAGADLKIEVPTGAAAISWIRVVDAWGTPLDYRYDPTGSLGGIYAGTVSLPQIRSAGPDKDFDTDDDITNK